MLSSPGISCSGSMHSQKRYKNSTLVSEVKDQQKTRATHTYVINNTGMLQDFVSKSNIHNKKTKNKPNHKHKVKNLRSVSFVLCLINNMYSLELDIFAPFWYKPVDINQKFSIPIGIQYNKKPARFTVFVTKYNMLCIFKVLSKIKRQ